MVRLSTPSSWHRVFRRLRRLRVDEVRHGLRLDQVHAPVEEGPLRELAASGLTAPRGQQRGQTRVQHHRRAVAVYLRAVLTGVAVGPCEPDAQHMVDDAAAPVQQVAIHHAARLLRTGGAAVSGAEHAVQRRQCAGAGQAQDADGTGQLGRGDGSDGVGHGGEPPCGRFFQYTTADVKRKGRLSPPFPFLIKMVNGVLCFLRSKLFAVFRN